MSGDQPDLDFTQPALPQSPAALRSSEASDARPGLSEQVCKRCQHWRMEHPFAKACTHSWCRCEKFESGVEVLSLDAYEPGKLSRRTDPPSSHAAAEHALSTGTVRSHEEKILRTLQQARRPLTAKEIGQRIHLTNVQVCRRLGEQGRLRTRCGVQLVEGDGEQRFEVTR